jgi:hypothetical protein
VGEKREGESRVWYWHSELIGGGRVTICFVEGAPGETVWIGAAWCAPGERWNRKLGNRIAFGRAVCERTARVFCGPSLDRSVWGKAALYGLVESGAPEWARRAARRGGA